MRENTAVMSRNVTSTVKMSIIGTNISSVGFLMRFVKPPCVSEPPSISDRPWELDMTRPYACAGTATASLLAACVSSSRACAFAD